MSNFANFEELWKAICEKYPDWSEDEHVVKQRARGLKKLLAQAWDEGHAKGVKNGRAVEKTEQERKVKPKPRSAADDLFNGMFGNKGPFP